MNIKKPVVDDHFIPLCDVLNDYIQNFEYPFLLKYDVKPLNYKATKDKKVILFSGGKVSLAVALHYKEMSADSVLFFVKDRFGQLKKTSREHEEAVRKLASKLELPIMVESIKLNPENPLYKLVMLNHAIYFAMSEGYDINIAMGLFDGTSRFNNPFSMISNAVEFRNCYEYVLQTAKEDFHIAIPMASYSYTWDVLKSHKAFIPYIYSESRLEEIVLYICRVDHNLLEEEDKSLYMKYIHKLHMKMEKELGVPVNDIKTVWKRYIPYPISMSKHKKEVIDLRM